MALVLDSTPGGAAANSYATAAEGDAYHEGRLFSTDWTGASAPTKEAALVWATRLLDGTIVWEGWPASSGQALQWPRSGLLARNPYVVVPSGVIPQELKNATAELARQLIVADRTADSDLEVQGIRSLRAGSVSLDFDGSARPRPIPDSVYALLPPGWILSSGRSSVRDLVRA